VALPRSLLPTVSALTEFSLRLVAVCRLCVWSCWQLWLQATKKAIEESEALKSMNRVIQDTIAPVGEIDIPLKHAFLAERIQEFNATVPYKGFSQPFLEQMNRPGRFEKDVRRRCFATVEAIFCLLPAPKKVRLSLLQLQPLLTSAYTSIVSIMRLQSCHRACCILESGQTHV
jgi:hypothetical protein